jgi:hypothetical protein
MNACDPNETPFEPLSQFQAEILRRMASEQVDFLIFGGYAVRFHGYLRPVADLDLLVATALANLSRLHRALAEVGLANLEREIPKLALPSKKMSLYDTVEVFSSIEGFTTAKLFANAVPFSLPLGHTDVDLRIVSLRDLAGIKARAAKSPDRGPKAEIDREDLLNLDVASMHPEEEPRITKP